MFESRADSGESVKKALLGMNEGSPKAHIWECLDRHFHGEMPEGRLDGNPGQFVDDSRVGAAAPMCRGNLPHQAAAVAAPHSLR
jgi:hypothetical protein